ncbi:ComEC/Rec2 family competence protein [Pseudanabaena sp. BC1403]|uniref:ComEC/Rec2 family competence protein n=1 Tax=Pseudanabaena sp. BC1403 TaxID=2043171 RepID=UPI000CD94AD7|nr:MBL fold metallo-hydrolase [Pseudanabaena sp. BC1403]
MSLPELIIFDVGHGNCALLRDTNGVILIDCPPGNILMEALEKFAITEISHVLISHADQDHIAGLPQLLLNVKVNNIHLNSDWLRDTDIWKDVCSALEDALKHHGVNLEVQLTPATTGRLNVGEVKIEILAPSPILALSGIGGQDLEGKRLSANTLSAVVSFVYNERRVAILAGDLDQTGLNNLIGESTDLQAEVLVFPHHGGRPGTGANSQAFAQSLSDLVKPQLVIFSIDRSLHKNPKDEIMQGVLHSVPNAHIMCTQLSEKCATSLPSMAPSHLGSFPSKGFIDNKCCGGTILIELSKDPKAYTPLRDAHKDFVAQHPNALCQRFISLTKSS